MFKKQDKVNSNLRTKILASIIILMLFVLVSLLFCGVVQKVSAYTLEQNNQDTTISVATVSTEAPYSHYKFIITQDGTSFNAVEINATFKIDTQPSISALITKIDKLVTADFEDEYEIPTKNLYFENIDLDNNSLFLTVDNYIVEGSITSTSEQGTLSIQKNSKVYIKGQNTNISATGKGMAIKTSEQSSLTVLQGKISTVSEQGLYSKNSDNYAIYHNSSTGRLTISGGEITSTKIVKETDTADVRANGIYNLNASKVTITGGKIFSEYVAIRTITGIVEINEDNKDNPTIITTTANTNAAIVLNYQKNLPELTTILMINGGIVENVNTTETGAIAIKNDGYNTNIEINDGTISGGTAILNVQDSSNLTVNGGSIIGKVAINNAGGTVVINGGTVTADSEKAVYLNGAGTLTVKQLDDSSPTIISAKGAPVEINSQLATVSISGGKLINYTNSQYIFKNSKKASISLGNNLVIKDSIALEQGIEAKVYTGEEIKPQKIEIMFKVLTYNDYTLTFNDNLNVGMANLSTQFNDILGFNAIFINYFEIVKSDAPIAQPTYNGADLKFGDVLPTITTKTNGGTIALKADQTLIAGTNDYDWVFTPDVEGNYNHNNFTGKISLTVLKGVATEVSEIDLNIKTSNSITINKIDTLSNGQTVEYAISTTKTLPTSGWQDIPVFEDLLEDTTYYIFARAKENENYVQGDAKITEIKTDVYVAPTPIDPNPVDDKNGLSGGAIAGIIIGSVVGAGIIAFAIYWFVIKKKTFSDIKRSVSDIFKKKSE